MVPSSSTTKSSWKLNMRSVCGNTCAITMGTSLRKGNDYRSVLKIPIKCQECGTTIVWLVGLLVRTRHNQRCSFMLHYVIKRTWCLSFLKRHVNCLVVSATYKVIYLYSRDVSFVEEQYSLTQILFWWNKIWSSNYESIHLWLLHAWNGNMVVLLKKYFPTTKIWEHKWSCGGIKFGHQNMSLYICDYCMHDGFLIKEVHIFPTTGI